MAIASALIVFIAVPVLSASSVAQTLDVGTVDAYIENQMARTPDLLRNPSLSS
jgi:hypothetical protein